MPTLSSVPDRKPIESVLELYRLEEGVDPYIATKIGILRQLINEEFVSKNKLVSSQFIYDVLKDGINQQVKSVLDSIPEPTIEDVFPSKPYDGTKTYEDMLQVVKYYKSAIQKIRSRYE